MPPHNGHLYLIDIAASQCDKLYVMICSVEGQPISGKRRYEWLKKIYAGLKSIEIVWCEDSNPQYPSECDSIQRFYQEYWVPSVYSRIKELDVVFTSESYGDEFAQYLGVEHVSVDMDRITYPVSGSAIRSNPFANWKYIPTEVRPYYIKKVVILGPESVGKSILVEKLSKHFNCPYIPEYGRTYSELKGKNAVWEKKDFEFIAIAHNLLIEQMFEIIGENYVPTTNLLIVDTEVLTTKVCAEMYMGERIESRVFDDVFKEQEFNLYIVLDIDVPWVDDGTREFENKRTWQFNKIKDTLDEHFIEYEVISGDFEERFNKAVALINAIL